VFISQHLLENYPCADYESVTVHRLRECRPIEEIDCTTGTGVQLCSYPQRELYSIESTGRRCGAATPIDSHLPEHSTQLRPTSTTNQATTLDLQLAPASTTAKANRANNDLRHCRPLEWQAQECDPSPPLNDDLQELRRAQECQSRNTTTNESPVSLGNYKYTATNTTILHELQE
jgi:hypothetical protein